MEKRRSSAKKGKSSLSDAKSYSQMGEFWDSHDLSRFWDQTEPAEFDVNVSSEISYYALDSRLVEQIRTEARKRGVSTSTLLHLMIKDQLSKEKNMGSQG